MNSFVQTVLVLVVLGAAVWIAIGKDKLAVAIRGLFKSKASKAADDLETVDSNVRQGQDIQADIVDKERHGLLELNEQSAASTTAINNTKAQVAKVMAAMAEAKREEVANHPGVDPKTIPPTAFYLAEYQKLQPLNDLLNTQLDDHQTIMNQIAGMEGDADQDQAKTALLESAGRVMIASGRRAQITREVNLKRSGFDGPSAQSKFDKARDVLDTLNSKAAASKVAVDGITPGERLSHQEDAMLANARKSSAAPSAQDMWNS